MIKGPAPTLAKIARPAASKPFLRPRLFDRLVHSGGRRMTWVYGPPGTGKTTLLSSYLDTLRLPHLWYQIDPEDFDLATFFYYLGRAIRQALPGRKQILPRFGPENLPGFRIFARRFADALAERIKVPTLLVFDNYEQVPANADLHEAIVELACRLPPAMRMLVASRIEPPAAFSRMRLHGDLVLVNPVELNLTAEEAQAFAAGQPGAEVFLDAARVGRVHRETEGWIAGFKLLLADPSATGPGPSGSSTGARQLVFDYFAREIFLRQPAAVQSTLMRTALLPVMSVPQAERMAGMPGVGTLLAELHRHNCFVVRRGDAEPWYEYHGLFRSFLLNHAGTVVPSGEWRELHCRAAEILAGAEQAEAAAQLYLAAEAPEELVRLAIREAPRLLAAGRHRLLAEWFGELPVASFRQRPWASYWWGMSRLPFDPAAARSHFERAYAEFRREDDPEGLYSTWSAVMESFFFEWRDLRPADSWIAELEDLRTRYPAFPSRGIELRTYCAMGTLAHRQPQHPLLAAWAERAGVLIDGDEAPELAVLLGGYLVICRLWWGESGQALDVIDRLDARARAQGFPPMVAIL